MHLYIIHQLETHQNQLFIQADMPTKKIGYGFTRVFPGGTWRIVQVSKWLITMVSKSSK